MTQVLIKAELLDGPPDEDGNVRVMIPYAEGTNPRHGRVRFVDPARVIVPVEAEAQIRRWPRMRMSKAYAAKLSIPVGAGAPKRKKDANHVNFWRYSSFDFNSVVVEIVELPEIDFDV